MTRASRKASPGVVSSSSEAPSTRWWESYLVRYFIGFIVGTVSVVAVSLELGLGHVLSSYITVPAGTTLRPDWSALLIGAALLGLGFCYIVSTPITVLHVGRYDRWIPDAHSRNFWFGWIGTLIFAASFGTESLSAPSGVRWLLLGLCLVAVWWLPVNSSLGTRLPICWKKDAEQRAWLQARPVLLMAIQLLLWTFLVWSTVGAAVAAAPVRVDKSGAVFWLLSAPVFWIGLMQYVVLARLLTDSPGLEEFYAKLFAARRQTNARDVRDTYTHLREHSNSVFIVVVELCVLASLLALKQITGFDTPGERSSYLQVVLGGLAIWMLPTLFMWARANALERSFANDPDRFLDSQATPASEPCAGAKHQGTAVANDAR